MRKSIQISFAGKGKNRPVINKKKLMTVLLRIAEEKSRTIAALQYVFMDDESLLAVNIQYLNHHTYTDIITFDLTEKAGIVGEIYISLERVLENAATYNVSAREELLRVLFHGALHLLGYKDKTAKDKQAMREAETYCINLYLEKEA